MKRKAILMIVAIIGIVGLSACSQPNPISFEIPYKDFVEEQHFTWITNVDVGKTIIINLGSNPTTGYTWPDVAQISNQNIVKQTEHEFISPKESIGVGASGKDSWTFKATEKGTTTISMDYSQPWDGGEKSEWSFIAYIAVK